MAFGMAGCSDSGSSDSDNESSAAAVQTESSAADLIRRCNSNDNYHNNCSCGNGIITG